MHPVGHQHEYVAHQQFALQVVHHYMVFCAHRTQQLVLEVGVTHHVVVGKLKQFAITQQVSPRITDMRQGIGLSAKHQRRERGQPHDGLAAPVDAGQPGVLRGDDPVQRHGGVPGFRRGIVIAHQAGHRGLGRFLAHAAGAHPIGNRHDGAHAFLPRIGQHGRAEIFIAGLAPSLSCKTNVYVECHAPWQASRMPNFGAPTASR